APAPEEAASWCGYTATAVVAAPPGASCRLTCARDGASYVITRSVYHKMARGVDAPRGAMSPGACLTRRHGGGQGWGHGGEVACIVHTGHPQAERCTHHPQVRRMRTPCHSAREGQGGARRVGEGWWQRRERFGYAPCQRTQGNVPRWTPDGRPM